MPPIDSERSLIAGFLLKDTPFLICESLLQDTTFKKNTGVVTNRQIRFSDCSSSFQLDKLNAVCRRVLYRKEPCELPDNLGQLWFIEIEENNEGFIRLNISRDSIIISLSDFSVLSHDLNTRLACFFKAAFDANLPQPSCGQWKAILEQQALEDDQFDLYLKDLYDTPVHFISSVNRLIDTPNVSISPSMLVPASLRYYERLVGTFDGSGNIQEYADGTAKIFFNNILKWSACDGLHYCLLLSSHSSFPAVINVEQIRDEELLRAFDLLTKQGDPLSRLGALELGLSIVDQRPQLEPSLLSLARSLFENTQQETFCEYHLFSSLFVLVDGTLASKHLFVDKPPFYRRLAALAQAAILHREISKSRIDLDKFSNWANDVGEVHFKLQTFMDMRLEPRWHPGLASKEQFKAEFIFRMLISGSKYSASLSDGELRDLFGDNPPDQLNKVRSDLRIFYPGPLDGGLDPLNPLPVNAAQLIEDGLQLDRNHCRADTFIPLIKFCPLFVIDSSYADEATTALGKFKTTFSGLVDKSQLLEILFGLAFVAASCHHKNLSCDVRNIVLRYRHNHQYRLGIDEVMAILLVASAARRDKKEWREFTGGWITDLAFGPLIDNEAKELYAYISLLLDLDPDLWCSCSKAVAATTSLFRYET